METYPEDGEEEDGEAEEEENGSGFDSDLADEINKGLEAMNAPEQEADDSEEDEGGLFGSGSDDDEEDEEDEGGSPEEVEQKRRIKLLLEETGDLDRAIASKQTELGKATNPIFRVRLPPLLLLLLIRGTETIRGHDQEAHDRPRWQESATCCCSPRVRQEEGGRRSRCRQGGRGE